MEMNLSHKSHTGPAALTEVGEGHWNSKREGTQSITVLLKKGKWLFTTLDNSTGRPSTHVK